MKKLGIILPLVLVYLTALSQTKEFYRFKFVEPNKTVVNTTLTRLVSISNVKNDTVFAYANASEMRLFDKLGYKYTLLPQLSLNSKAIVMASTLDGMINWDKYPTYSVYRSMMKRFEQNFPSLCKLDSIGTTPNGHKIYVVKLSSNVSVEEPEVEVFYTSTMHGDETTGYILMLRLIDYLLANYASDTRIASMLNSMAIYINPNANPDGTYYGSDNSVAGATRYNGSGYLDLNRKFPDPRVGDPSVIPEENQIMMSFAAARHFTLSANFHDGVELVNYPWDTWVSASQTHPDNSWFVHVSRQYADSAQVNSPLGYFDDENNGITEGGDWYVVAGGRQDYMNWWHHCKEITIELSPNVNDPTPCEHLQNYWNYNKAGLITYLESSTKGFNGIVTNALGIPIKAKISIAGHDTDSSYVYSSSSTGFYARPIEFGTWQVTYSAKGYFSQTHVINVANWESSIIKNVQLSASTTVIFDIVSQNTPILDANVNFNGVDLLTLSNGKAIFNEVQKGSGHIYTVSKNGYHTITGSLDIKKDTALTIDLLPYTYSVTFNVKHSGVAVANTTIDFLGVQKQANFEGVITFSNVPFGNGYIYSVRSDGYENAIGQVYVKKDTVISIELFSVGVLKTDLNDFFLKVWPNPFLDEINLSFNLDSPSVINLSIYSIEGKLISTIANGWGRQGGNRYRWSVGATPIMINKGSYIVKLQIDKKTFSQIVVSLR